MLPIPVCRWFLEYNLVLPDGVISFFDNKNYYDNLEMNTDLKKDAGFNTSITDVSPHKYRSLLRVGD